MVHAVHQQLLDVGQSFGAVGLILGAIALLWRWPLGPVVRWFRAVAAQLGYLRDIGAGRERGGMLRRPCPCSAHAVQPSRAPSVRPAARAPRVTAQMIVEGGPSATIWAVTRRPLRCAGAGRA